MPLTIAHSAAVLPLRQTGLPFSALVIGSLAPDLEYLFRLAPAGQFGHSLKGLFLFCIPVGLCGLWLFHRVWCPAATFVMERVSDRFEFLPAKRFALISLAILIGAFTHVVWDSFTHSYGWMVLHSAVLSATLLNTPWGPLKTFKLLQHLGTVVGLTAIVITSLPALRDLSKRAWMFFATLLCASVVGGVLIGVLRAGAISTWHDMRVLVGVTVVGSFVAFIIETTAVSILWFYYKRSPNRLRKPWPTSRT